jgi:deazaflavin-dependent oxidoreductase (nitroreductase family)
MIAMQRGLFVLTNKVVNRAVRALGVERFRGARLLHLTTTGRKSGKLRSVPLAFVPDGDDYVVAASNGGADWEPAWWLNLQADPHGTVTVGKRTFAVTASAVEDRDRARLWQALSDQLDTYDGYQRKVRRRIELVRLRPDR